MSVDISKLIIGQVLVLLKDIYVPFGETPGGMFARKGEIVYVKIIVNPTSSYSIHVSHNNILDRSFGVNPDEVMLQAEYIEDDD